GVDLRNVLVRRLDVVDRLAVQRRPGALRGVREIAFERELDILGGDLVAVVPFHTLAYVESPQPAVWTHFVAFGEPRHDIAVCVVPQRRLEDHVLGIVRLGENHVVVLGTQIGDGDVERASTRGRSGRWRDRWRRTRHAGSTGVGRRRFGLSSRTTGGKE